MCHESSAQRVGKRRYRYESRIGTIDDVSKQIAVRLPDEIVEFIDGEVEMRHIASRAAFVQAALARERRRLIAARDAEILSRQAGAPDEFDDLARYAAGLQTGLE